MPATGLSNDEASRRLLAEGPNELPSARPRTLANFAAELLREPMILLLVAVGFTYLALGDRVEAFAIVGAVLVVVGLTLYQERKTERTLSALRDLTSPRALVIRSGSVKRIAGRDVVRDDLIVLDEGGRVPADGILVAATNLAVDESLLTGESLPVRKRVPATEDAAIAGDLARVRSGTLIVSGHGTARVTATGRATEIGAIGRSIADVRVERTSLQRQTSRLVTILAIAGLASCGVVALVYGMRRGQWLDGALAGLTMAIAMVPEEFPVVLTVFLALGAWRISRHRVLTRRIPAVETLGSATVLCVDKTGTLTLNRMAVAAIHAAGRTASVENGTALDAAFLEVLEASVLASRPDPFDPMERAFIDLSNQLNVQGPSASWTLTRTYPMSDACAAVANEWRSRDGRNGVVALKGAPEAVLGLCRLDQASETGLLAEVERMAGEGLRVLAVARARDGQRGLPDLADFEWSVLGLIGLADPIRPEVPEAIEECRAAGIRVVMITGDYPATAMHIARRIGLGQLHSLTGAELAALDEDALRHQVQTVDVFARMVPAQKLRLVKALRASGEVVAMTGDGVNDAPALKAADIGIAMGGRGTDVAREAAGLVLLDDDFASIVHAIRLGRRIYDNIQKAMGYVLAVHLPIAGMSLVPVLSGGPLILMPLHLIFMELIVDPACSVAFEMEPEEAGIMQRPPRDPRAPLFSRRLVVRSLLEGAGVFAVTAIAFAGAMWLGRTEREIRTLTFATLILGNLVLIGESRSGGSIVRLRADNPALRWLALAAVTLLALVLYAPPLNALFRVSRPRGSDLAIIAATVVTMLIWMEVTKALTRRS